MSPPIVDKLNDMFDTAESLELPKSHRIVVFSDLHLGNGGSNDDFRRNSQLFTAVLRDYYLLNGYTLILNGDVEELQRFTLKAVQRTWASLYELFDRFYEDGRLVKTVGNHDHELYTIHHPGYRYRVRPSVRYRYHENDIFIIHGHQASNYFERWHTLNSFALRYIANPLKITSKSVAHDSRKKYRTERRVYEFSTGRKIITIIGHTHRPLFESHSKIDELKFKIENSLRAYSSAAERKQKRIRKDVLMYKDELSRLYEKHEATGLGSSLYNELLVPSVFNSGCIIGKRGMTGIEIVDGDISLVQWFDARTNKEHLKDAKENEILGLGDSPYHRRIIKTDSLEYVFARIRLLS